MKDYIFNTKEILDKNYILKILLFLYILYTLLERF